MGGNRNVYYCVKLPDEILEELMAILDEIKSKYDHFKPHTLNSLHMTFIYLGDNLSYQDTSVYAGLIEELNFKEEWKFEFETFDLFPPGKQNLIVAKFKNCSEIKLIRDELVKKIGPDKLKDELPFEWIPHITLGKLVGKQRQINLSFTTPPDFKTSSFTLVNPYYL